MNVELDVEDLEGDIWLQTGRFEGDRGVRGVVDRPSVFLAGGAIPPYWSY
jgi:hypothetical protein